MRKAHLYSCREIDDKRFARRWAKDINHGITHFKRIIYLRPAKALYRILKSEIPLCLIRTLF